ncbi:MAG: FIST N-terminal domain-containing protein [Verrucomicrobiales bacterium]|nr:FIST N-terminal domain-containing protein [Verrucomicrobiales bacterium]
MSSPFLAASKTLLTEFDEPALVSAVQEARLEVGGEVSIAFVFASSHWQPHLDDLVEIIQIYGHAPHIVGCSADGLISTGQEDENATGISLLFLNLPGAKIDITSLSNSEIAELASPLEWEQKTNVPRRTATGWLSFANPAGFNGETWLHSWNAAYPNTPTFGGLASGSSRPENFFVFHNRPDSDTDAVLVHIGGSVRIAGVVSQGCRPIGQPYTITKAADNVIFRIASKRAYEVLEEAFESLPDDDQEQARGNIFAGLATSEYLADHRHGDFLVRNILGGDPDAGAIALSAFPRVGQTLQFQLRDGDTADEDLRYRTHKLRADLGTRPFASLLFSCTGRGSPLFGFPNHDVGVIEDVFGPTPVAGFFCNGEIGPVGDMNFLHSYTASAAFFVENNPRQKPQPDI